MEVMEFRAWPQLPCEKLQWALPGFPIRDPVEDMIGMHHCERPHPDVCHVGPVNGAVVQHGPGQGHNSQNSAFRQAVRMMGTHSRVFGHLMELLQMIHKFLILECSPVIR